MKNIRNFQDKDFEDLVKRSFMLDPSDIMEERIMKRVYAEGNNQSVRSGINKWIAIMVYSILAAVFAYLLLMPTKFQFLSKVSTTLNIKKLNIIDPEVFNLGTSQPYLIMSTIVFAVAVWLIIILNLPKKDSARRFI